MFKTSKFNPWLIVVASFCSLFLGMGTIGYVLGVFLKPISVELGIGRSIISAGILTASLVNAAGSPFIGIALDRWGSRKVLLPMAALFAAVIASFSMLVPSSVLIMALFVLLGFSGVAMTPIPYARGISLWFDERRGLALGLSIAGIGLGIAIVPKLAGFLIATQGWRHAFLILAAIVLCAAFIPIAVCMKEPSEVNTDQDSKAAVTIPGVEARAAFKTWRFWAMTLAFFFAIVAINGCVSHLVALLTDRGMPAADAASAIALIGLSALISRLVSGWLLDRVSGVKLAVFFFLAPACGIALIASGVMGFIPFVGAILCGIAIGGEVDLLAYFVGRYFGLKHFGEIYGLIFAAFSAGFGVGPFISGIVFDKTHSYGFAFAIYIGLLVLAAALVSRLGPYEYPARRHAVRQAGPMRSDRSDQPQPHA
ncbi:putative MFS family arabinose efflux permease [Paraburkholderia sp. BL23I1N1]|uniref:MFS transporter n=1 Tax=Paraburkholderia sp. BL23I1N1 TaxID=1938802 RepID=UPI000FF58010|nr:MFS transporter [Paraburkholderia sp. BL23I1N1]RKE38572.1 putative MFS family arabinose efflux permease [Paraburkholderia sp. BL23I1N1]